MIGRRYYNQPRPQVCWLAHNLQRAMLGLVWRTRAERQQTLHQHRRRHREHLQRKFSCQNIFSIKKLHKFTKSGRFWRPIGDFWGWRFADGSGHQQFRDRLWLRVQVARRPHQSHQLLAVARDQRWRHNQAVKKHSCISVIFHFGIKNIAWLCVHMFWIIKKLETQYHGYYYCSRK